VQEAVLEETGQTGELLKATTTATTISTIIVVSRRSSSSFVLLPLIFLGVKIVRGNDVSLHGAQSPEIKLLGLT